MPFICIVARTLAILLANQVRYGLWQYCSNITRTGSVDSFGSIAAIMPEKVTVIAAILPETNLHAKSSITTILRQYCQNMLQQHCGTVAAIYFQKLCILVRVCKKKNP